MTIQVESLYCIAGIKDTLCLCYCFLCVLFTLAYVWWNDPANSCLHIDYSIECSPHIHQPIHHTQKVGTFVEQISDFSCVKCMYMQHVVWHNILLQHKSTVLTGQTDTIILWTGWMREGDSLYLHTKKYRCCQENTDCCQFQ